MFTAAVAWPRRSNSLLANSLVPMFSPLSYRHPQTPPKRTESLHTARGRLGAAKAGLASANRRLQEATLARAARYTVDAVARSPTAGTAQRPLFSGGSLSRGGAGGGFVTPSSRDNNNNNAPSPSSSTKRVANSWLTRKWDRELSFRRCSPVGSSKPAQRHHRPLSRACSSLCGARSATAVGTSCDACVQARRLRRFPAAAA